MVAKSTQYTGLNSGRGLSPMVWQDCPIQEYQEQANGFFFFDDFLNCPTFASATSQAGYITYQDTGVTIGGLATERGGVIRIAGNDADNDEGILTTGGNLAGMASISDTAGSNFKLWFEARVRTASVADNALPFFVGLGEEGLAATATLVDDTGVLKTTADFVGFHSLAADGDAMLLVHQKASVTPVVVSTQVIAASTWYKLGMYYDGTKLRYYIDGVEITTPSTRIAPAATGFPDAEELALVVAAKVGAAVEVEFDMDWWAVAGQLEV